MEMNTNHATHVLTDSMPISNFELDIHSGLFPYSSGAAFSSELYISIPRKKAIPNNLDDVRSGNWLDSMKSSSPSHKKPTKDSNVEVASDDSQLIYRSWMYPSALASFEQIMNNAKGKRIVLFLDYDDTLSPIVDDPDRAFMSSAVLEVRPVIDWDKGKAEEFLLDSLGLSECDDVLPMYVGDDRTDEDAFKIMHIAAAIEINSRFIPKLKQLHTSLHLKMTNILVVVDRVNRWRKSKEKAHLSAVLT